MKMRKITSLTAALSFALMVLTSIVLYIVPQGRVAYWADWRLWGMTKTDWGNIHINLGLLFLLAGALHIYYNWKPLVSYLRNKGRRLKLFTLEFNAALLVTVAVALGTYWTVPPFGWVMALNEHFKDSGAEKYGEPPYGHAELSSLKTFAQRMNLDPARSLALLEKAGYKAASTDETLAAIARRYGVPPQRIYLAIQPAKADAGAGGVVMATLPESPVPGTGNATLADFCAQHGLNLPALVRKLGDQGVQASAEATLKKIAGDNGLSPADLYQTIRAVVDAGKTK